MRRTSKPRLFWSPRFRCWIYYSSWVRGKHDLRAEAFLNALNRVNHLNLSVLPAKEIS